MAKNIVIITGASSGIGKEFALQMDPCFQNIDEFWLIARSKDKLKELAASLKHPTRILAMDLTNEAQIERLTDTLKDHDATIRVLINCAGYGLMGNADAIDIPGQLGMVRLNCEALTHVTLSCLPFLKRGSHIIQLASSAAFLPQPAFAVYAASKSYVLSFSRALGAELSEKGIYVTSVCPGPVDTPFFDIAEKGGTTLAVKKLTLVSPKRVVRQALLDSARHKTMSVCSLPIKAFFLASKFLPTSLLLSIVLQMKKAQKTSTDKEKHR